MRSKKQKAAAVLQTYHVPTRTREVFVDATAGSVDGSSYDFPLT